MPIDETGVAVAPEPFKGLSDAQFEAVLDDPTRQDELRRYFGEQSYREIMTLRGAAKRHRGRFPEKVLILPGIMGSELAIVRGWRDDVVWLDFADIMLGSLFNLKLNGSGLMVKPVGVLRRYYYKLKAALEAAGYDAEFFPFDWRLNIQTSGQRLNDHIARLGRPVHLVAHSMGGLVARVAADPRQSANGQIKKVIQLGTPNYGSYSPVLAFLGIHDVARKVALLDPFHSVDEYRSQLFMSFPGLYEMLPSPDKTGALDLFEPNSWPEDVHKPSADYLGKARAFQRELYGGDGRFTLIAGVNQATKITAKINEDGRQFAYAESLEGDGTVPLSCCLLPNVTTYYALTEHGALPNDMLVGLATGELLQAGKTDRLPTSWQLSTRAAPRGLVTDTDIKARPIEIDREHLTDEQKRDFLSGFLSTGASSMEGDRGVKVGGDKMSATASPLRRTVVSQNTGRTLEVRIIEGNLTNIRAPVYVLGLYEGVNPTAAARSVDSLAGGKIMDLMTRRSLEGGIGKLSFLPTTRHPLLADQVAFVGLGKLNEFTPQVLEVVGETIIWHFEADRISEITTVAIGLGSGFTPHQVMGHLFRGFVAGLTDRDEEHVIKTINICDFEPRVCDELERVLLDLSRTELFDGFQVAISRHKVPKHSFVALPEPQDKDPIYLQVRMGETATRNGGPISVETSLLTSGSQAAIARRDVRIEPAQLDAFLQHLAVAPAIDTNLGRTLADLLIDKQIQDVLWDAVKNDDRPIVVLHDAGASRVPWETIALEDALAHGARHPAQRAPMSRHYMATGMSAAKWASRNQQRTEMNVLLVVNPTGDLPGADEEGRSIQKALEECRDIRLHSVSHGEASKERLIAELGSGKYDIVHYAGHAFFDPANPGRSGLVCAGNVALTGEEIAGITKLPGFMFFNACEAGRIRRGRNGAEEVAATAELAIERNVGLAEAFLRGGILHYLGTYWPVNDLAAKAFACEFYPRLLKGETIGEAIFRARQVIGHPKDWADYIHYGNPNFRLKRPE